MATGHYARATRDDVSRRPELRRAADARKDQSYFLYGLTRDELAAIQFPLGDLTKVRTRELAAGFGFDLAEYRESQDFCFVGEEHYGAFLRDRFENRFAEGRIVDPEGRVVGRHHGIHLFTFGQRRGLGIAAGKPLYVLRIEPETNTVVVGPREATFRRSFIVRSLNWTSIDPPTAAFAADVKVRAAHHAAPATVTPRSDGSVAITFADAQHAITPGQAAVFYREDLVMGGGTIDVVEGPS